MSEVENSKTATDRWLGRMRWVRHRVLYPLVVIAGVVWIVRQVT